MTGAWSLVCTDLAGNNRAFLNGIGFTHTRRLNGQCEISFTNDSRDDKAPELLIGQRAVKSYRDGTLRHYGKIWEPTSDKPDYVSITCVDSWGNLTKRNVRTTTTYAATDAGAIAWGLINDQNGYGTTRLKQGAIDTSVNRDRTYDPNSSVTDLILQLSEVINGFWFRIDPVDNDATYHNAFVVKYPTSGSTHADVRFEYGDGTLDNCTDYEMQQTLPVNRITALGSLVDGTTLTSVSSDSPSIIAYDIVENQISFSTVIDQATLDQHAAAEIRPNPIKTYTFVPGRGAPVLYDQFDVGDVVQFAIRHGRLNEAGAARVTEAIVSVSDDSTELLTSITLELLTT